MISAQRLGERIAAARKRAGLTQAQVAEALGLARTTVVAIEKGDRRPSNRELVKLAEVVDIDLHEILREGSLVARAIPRVRGSLRDAGTVERLARLAARYVELERLHGLYRRKAPLQALDTYRLGPDEPAPRIDPQLEARDAASTVRGMLGLGDEPAMAIEERLEAEAGLRIFYLDGLPPSLCSVLVLTDVTGACIALNAAHSPERQRWSLLHELGHFLRDPAVGHVLETTTRMGAASELFPEAFAKEFLLPVSGVHKRFAERCRAGKFTPLDVHAMARAFGVSFSTMALRLEELQLLPRGTYERIAKSSLPPEPRQGPGEPTDRGAADPVVKLPARYVALAISAYDQGLLSETELAEHLETDIPTARHVYQSNNTIALDDSLRIAVDLSGADLRSP